MIKTRLKLSALFTVISMIAVGVTLYAQQEMLADLMKEAEQELPFPMTVLYLISAVQTGALTFGLTFIGLLLAEKVNLKLTFFYALFDKNVDFRWSRKWLLASVFGGFAGFLLIYILDYFYFAPYIPQLKELAPITWWKGLLMGILYGGIWEELAIRLFLMSTIVWVLTKLFRTRDKISSYIYWLGIFLAAIFFGIGHLPATIQLFGELTPIIIIRAILLNSLLGIYFGFLYWRKDLIYAIIAHACVHIFNYAIFTHLVNL